MENTDYECYVLGCRSTGEEPLEELRFRVLQAEFLRRAANQDSGHDHSPIPQFVLEQLALRVAEGYKIAAGGRTEDEEPETAACGVREPRSPREPVLTGCAARSLSSADTPDYLF